MKQIIKAALLSIAVIITQQAHAEIPKTLLMQSLIYEPNGLVTTKDRADITVNILNEEMQELFTESHADVPVVKGAFVLSIGSTSPNGELPADLFDPTQGTRFIQMVVEGNEGAFEVLPFHSVPYAYYAEQAQTVAVGSVGSEQIKDHSIQLVDLVPGLAFSDLNGVATEEQLPQGLFAKLSDLAAHKAEDGAHSARSIIMEKPLAGFLASTVEEALVVLSTNLWEEEFDRQDADKKLKGQVNQDIDNLKTTVDQHETQINTLSTTDTQHAAQINTLNTTTNQHTTQLGILNANVTNLENSVLYKNGSAAMTGDLNMGGKSITNVNKVDGVDVSGLKNTVDIHSSQLAGLMGATTPKIDAWVYVLDDSTATAGMKEILASVNVSSVQYVKPNGEPPHYVVTFTNALDKDKYAAFVTADAMNNESREFGLVYERSIAAVKVIIKAESKGITSGSFSLMIVGGKSQ